MRAVYLQLKLRNLEVDLSLPAQGVSAIIGPSGAGKTTLLRAVAGLESAARGRVVMNGEIWQDDTRQIFLPTYQRAIGFVFQEPGLFAHLSVQANLEFGLRRIPVARQKVALLQTVELLGIASLLKRSPATLSGGETQRVSIARALATSPKLLLMDEPFASLDEQRKAEILPYLDRLQQKLNIPVLYVSHATDEVARLADYVVMLEAGRVRACGSVAELLTRADLPFAHGEHASAFITGKIIAHDAHYQLIHIEFAGGTLWVSHSLAPLGETVRVRILACDVSLSVAPPVRSSILNSLAVTISAMHADAAGLLMVELDVTGTQLLALIPRKSVDQLGLRVGMKLVAQIKSVTRVK